MVIPKRKGSNAERELIHMFWNNNIAAARIAGSGSANLPMPDIIAGKSNTSLVIECKNTINDYVYLKEKEIFELEKFALISGMIPFIALKVKNKGWFFLHTNSLKKTNNMYVFNINNKNIENKILRFDKIVNFLNINKIN